MGTRNRILSIGLFATIAFAVLFLYLFFFGNRLSDRPIVLVVADTFSSNSFGALVTSGFEQARKDAASAAPSFDYINVDLVDPVNAREGSLSNLAIRSRLIDQISRRNVVAIVSANTSLYVNEVMKVAAAFDLPVLITVATQNRPRDGFPGKVYRLPAPNSSQAQVIANWCTQFGKSPVAVMINRTAYSDDLRQTLDSERSLTGLISFELNKTTDVIGLLKYGKEAQVAAWIVIGYQEDAIDVLSKKLAVDAPGPVLMTDGAYGQWLKRLQRIDQNRDVQRAVYITLPSGFQEKSETPGMGVTSPFYCYGYDAYQIIESAIKDARSRKAFARLLGEKANKLSDDGKSKMLYSFDNLTGENVLATFDISEIRHGQIP